jgi:glycosyltransferase involved in cell wall biosynthesis
MALKTISVVIPAYNAERTVKQAILAAVGQRPAAHEVIVVDDGSTDGTAQVAEHWAANWPLRIIRQRNQGSAVARQTGSEAATGEYIAYLDADDWWETNDTLKAFQESIALTPIDWLFGDLQRGRYEDDPEQFSARNSTFHPWAMRHIRRKGAFIPYELYQLEPKDGLELVLRGFPVYPSTLLVRKEALQAVGGWDSRFRRCQDFDLAIRLARRYPLHYLDRIQAIVGFNAGNPDANRYETQQKQGDIAVLQAHLAAESDPLHRRALEHALALKYAGLGYVLRKSGRPAPARDAYRHAMSLPGVRMNAFIRWAVLSMMGKSVAA